MADVRTGRPQADPTASAHMKGVKSGNSKGNYEREPGMLPDGRRTARASTGITSGKRDPVDERMPNLPPG